MAVPTCIKCSGHGFELVSFAPIGESRKITVLQCASCGTPVSVLPQTEAIRDQVASIDERLTRIAKALTE
jgi:hypothetical protein